MPTLLSSRDVIVAPLPGVTDFPPRPVHAHFSGADDLAAPLILVVDDHDDSRAIVRIVLESVGFQVAEAATGIEGLRAAITLRPMLVLLDMILPGLDGWEIARRLRREDATRSSVIIALTALAGQDDQDRAEAAGCDEVLIKPVSPSKIVGTIRRYIGMPMRAGRAS